MKFEVYDNVINYLNTAENATFVECGVLFGISTHEINNILNRYANKNSKYHVYLKIKDTLKYKCNWNGIHLIMAPTFYASSKYCSICGHKHNDLKLSDREWTCSNCGTHLDRDVNAAKNLQFFGLWMIDKHLSESSTTVSSTESNACGDERLQFLTEQCSSMKQEFKSQNNAMRSFA